MSGSMGGAKVPPQDSMPVAVCKDNTGMEEFFDEGVEYVVSPCASKGFLRVYDRFDGLRECFRSRFSAVLVAI